MLEPALTIDESPSAEDIALVAQGMRRHALSQIDGDESPPIACFVRENGVIVGGVVSRIVQRRMFVDLLWVDETRRNRGLGSALLQSMERVARDRGCRDICVSRPAAFVNPLHPGEDEEFRESQIAAQRLGLTLRRFPVRTVAEVNAALQAMARDHIDGVVTFSNALIMSQRNTIAE
ncbi:MAG: GNAT family N-acetyltransferase, partial [Betaproteobacteria bacterium]